MLNIYIFLCLCQKVSHILTLFWNYNLFQVYFTMISPYQSIRFVTLILTRFDSMKNKSNNQDSCQANSKLEVKPHKGSIQEKVVYIKLFNSLFFFFMSFFPKLFILSLVVPIWRHFLNNYNMNKCFNFILSSKNILFIPTL